MAEPKTKKTTGSKNGQTSPKDVDPTALQNSDLERERLLSLINSMADGVLALEANGQVAVYNGAALNLLDLNTSPLNKHIAEILNLVDNNNQKVDLRKYLANTLAPKSSRDYKITYPDGSKINVYLSISPVRLGFGKGGSQGFVLLLRDITREKSLEEERDEFISVASHELRTPVTIAEGNIGNIQYMLEKADGNDQIKEAVNQAHGQIVFLSGLINDLSTLSRAERGVLKVEVESINPFDLVQDLALSYKKQAEAKGLSIKIDLDPQLELLRSCSLYVREILQNFITNAIKYTDKGHITVSAKRGDNGVLFSVSDTGIGIGDADQEKVFDKFFRSEDFRTRANNGTGLGLYVTMKLTRLIHADISLESELNKGSTFSLAVPNLQ